MSSLGPYVTSEGIHHYSQKRFTALTGRPEIVPMSPT